MKIWVDGDACPVAIKEILYRAAERAKLQLILVANQSIRVPDSPLISSLQVSEGFDMADRAIVERMEEGDLVITADIPLASDVIEKGGLALDPRGQLYTADTIKERLQIRDFMETLRSSGVETGGPPALSQKDRREFAGQLDRLLTEYMRTGKRHSNDK